MLEQAISSIATLATQSEAIKVLNNLDDTDQRITWCDVKGVLTPVAIKPPLRNYETFSLASFAECVENCKAESCSVWHGFMRIVGLFDDSDRRERVSLLLRHTSAFAILHQLGANGKKLTQKELLRMLSFDLAESLVEQDIVPTLRKVNLKKGVEANTQIVAGRESIDRSLTAELTGVGDIPEAFTVHTAVYDNAELREDITSIRVSIEFDFAEEKFLVVPFPLSVMHAIEFAQIWLRQRLALLLECPIYFGNP